MRLKTETSDLWTQHALAHFDDFLIDHAACERKASALAMSLVAHYPNQNKLVASMIELAREELEHFSQVYQIISNRKLHLVPDVKDPYVGRLKELIRNGADAYFLDRLIIAGVIEARGCERFGKIAEALEPGEMKDFYWQITRSEARHHGLFIRLAKEYFESQKVEARLEEILEAEAKIVSTLELRAAVH